MIKTRIFVVVSAAIFHIVLLSLGSPAQATDGLPARLKSTLLEYDSAWNRKDVAAVSKTLAADYTYFTSTGGTSDRKQTLAFLASPNYKLTFAERSELTLVSADKRDVAVVSSRWKGRGTYGKEAINDDQRCGLVFIKEGTEWKLLSEHCVQIAAR